MDVARTALRNHLGKSCNRCRAAASRRTSHQHEATRQVHKRLAELRQEQVVERHRFALDDANRHARIHIVPRDRDAAASHARKPERLAEILARNHLVAIRKTGRRIREVFRHARLVKSLFRHREQRPGLAHHHLAAGKEENICRAELARIRHHFLEAHRRKERVGSGDLGAFARYHGKPRRQFSIFALGSSGLGFRRYSDIRNARRFKSRDLLDDHI